MLAFCGIDCSNCKAYKGTVSGDLSQLEAAATTYGGTADQAKDWVCLGCQPADQPFIAKYCGECGVRKCAIAKGKPNCAACDEYDGCERIHKFLGDDTSELSRKMNLLRAHFVASHPCGGAK